MYLNVCMYSCSPNITGGASTYVYFVHLDILYVGNLVTPMYTYTKQAIKKLKFYITCILLYAESNHERVSVKKTEVGTHV